MCLQVRGRATLHQAGHELTIGQGHLAVYDTRLPYDLRLEGDWECAVMAFRPSALTVPARWLPELMGHVHDATAGPGAVLTSFVEASLASAARPAGSVALGAGLRFADAGLQLLSSTLTSTMPPALDDEADDALRMTVLSYVRRHLHDLDLCHASVAHAHRMSARTLDRLFQDDTKTVTAVIRDLRLDGARRDLHDPRSAHHTVGAVAARWCFGDAAHFSRVYRKRFGASPSRDR